MFNLSTEFNEFYEKARNLIETEQDAEQVIIVRTESNKVHSFTNHGNGEEEELAFGQFLSKNRDVQITELLCMWNTMELDVPSIYMRTLLLNLHPENEKAKLILQGKDGYIIKELGRLV